MSKQKVVKPGIWWIVRFRRIESYAWISGYMTCKNAHHAGHSGFHRKQRYVKGLGKNGPLRYVPRKWDVKDSSHRRLAYRFAKLSDLKTAIRAKLIQTWISRYDVILEIVQIEGCTFYGTVTSTEILERQFPPGTNEMEILALEYAMGE